MPDVGNASIEQLAGEVGGEVGQAPAHGEGRRALGAWGERVAAHHLACAGLEVVERNWRADAGELDLACWDPEERTWVAVEVKTRRSTAYGDPIEAVTPVKVARLRRLARAWVAGRPHAARLRIDVVGVLVQDGAALVSHLRAVG